MSAITKNEIIAGLVFLLVLVFTLSYRHDVETKAADKIKEKAYVQHEKILHDSLNIQALYRRKQNRYIDSLTTVLTQHYKVDSVNSRKLKQVNTMYKKLTPSQLEQQMLQNYKSND